MAAAPIQSIVDTLFLGLEELAPIPQDSTQVAMLRAMYSPDLRYFPQSPRWQFEQSFAPYADALEAAGYPVTSCPIVPAQDKDRVLVVATRFAEENLALLARGWQMLKSGGVLIAAQHNDLGAKRLDAVMKQLTGHRESLSKHHCRAVAVVKPPHDTPHTLQRMTEWAAGSVPRLVEGAPLLAAPGMFSWRKVDVGSRLLIESLPSSLTGYGADVAAGWGYLSWALLQRDDGIRHITLYEAEKRALELAERNLAANTDRCRFIWCDATRPLDTGGQKLDWAVMNPPAHDMLWSAPEASAAMFARVAEALRPAGRLWLVANSYLPYERTLEAHFSTQSTLRDTGEYKVIEAVK